MRRHIVTGPYHGESYSLWYIVRLEDDGEAYDVLESRRNRDDAEECAARLDAAEDGDDGTAPAGIDRYGSLE